MTPELKISLAKIVPKGLENASKSIVKKEGEKAYRGTCEYASIICSEVAWNSKSRPVVPAASRLIAARTLEKVDKRCGRSNAKLEEHT